MAKSGELEAAFEFAKETKQLAAAQRLFHVHYIDTLVKLSDTDDKKTKIAILNEAIITTNELRQLSLYNGSGDAETAYHFMVAVGNLADHTVGIHKPSASQLKTFQGSIARKLNTNPMFPADAKESLADAVIALAEAHALKGEQELAMEAVSEAFGLGFCEFDELAANEIFSELEDPARFQQHLKQLKQAYLVKVQNWSEQVIRNFQPFAFQFTVDDIEGGDLTSREFSDSVLVVDFWATWCAPCRKGIPHFIELQKRLGHQGVQVVGISMDSPDDPTSSLETVRNFVEDNEFTYPCGLGSSSIARQVPGEMKLPTTLFIDRQGNVRYIATGYLDYAKLEALAKTLADEEQHVNTGMDH